MYKSYTIPIPDPVMPGQLEQLAQIQVPTNNEGMDDTVAVYWMRSSRQAICNYAGKWYSQSDQNIITGIANIIQYGKNIELLTVDDLFIFETPGHGRVADDDMVNDFRNCDWSDYASDRIAFQCVLREKTAVAAAMTTATATVTDDIERNKNESNVTNIIYPNTGKECCCIACNQVN